MKTLNLIHKYFFENLKLYGLYCLGFARREINLDLLPNGSPIVTKQDWNEFSPSPI